VLSIIDYGGPMADGGGGFSYHCHNKAVAMQIFHGGRFCYLGVVTNIGNIGKKRWRHRRRTLTEVWAKGPF